MAFRYLSCLLLFLALTCVSWAQTSTGTIKGTVIDGSGAPIPEATVRQQGTSTGLLRTQPSNSEGVFEFPLALMGTYIIFVEKQGFHRGTVQGVSL